MELLRYLCDRIAATHVGHPLRVAIDGVDTAGKTIFADDLAALLEDTGSRCIRAGIDGFHHPRARRYRQGPMSPAGYFEDSFDAEVLREVLLDPLGPNGTRRFRRRVFDHLRDTPVTEPEEHAHADSILLFDGVFLLRPELADSWDFSIFLRVSFETVLRRAVDRDVPASGTSAEVKQRYLQRYIPGQKTYLASCEPEARADVLIDNERPASPQVLRS